MTNLLDTVGQFMAAITGQRTYTRAIRQTTVALKDQNKAQNKQLSSLDKLNNLTSDKVGANNGGAGQMFEEVSITKNYFKLTEVIKNLKEHIKKIIEDFSVGDFFQAGKDISSLVAGIFNFFAKAIDRVNWLGIGRKIGDFFAGLDWFSILKSVGRVVWEAYKRFWKFMPERLRQHLLKLH
ncbi:MAG: hypothetical protein K2J60_07925 [Acetatifactor sp.]|nr:hypothetical protein [Acetatifactor sp.]